jgi:hypothetical protein
LGKDAAGEETRKEKSEWREMEIEKKTERARRSSLGYLAVIKSTGVREGGRQGPLKGIGRYGDC